MTETEVKNAGIRVHVYYYVHRPMDKFLPCKVLLLIFDQNICGVIVRLLLRTHAPEFLSIFKSPTDKNSAFR